jgi:predicted peptidase
MATDWRPERNFSPWFQVVSRLAATVEADPLPDDDLAGYPAWRERFESRFGAELAPWPEPVDPRTEIDEGVAVDGYRRHRVVFDSEADMSVPAYLLVPDGRREPGSGVLAVHGHGPGKSRICGLEPGDEPGGDYAAELARRGHVVLAPDLRCFGERLDWNPEDHYACDTNLVHQVMAGWSPLTQNLWDCSRALDVLASHPLVDPSRMGVVGFSYGGTIGLFLAAVDRRVSAAVVSGYFSSWAESHKMPWNMCGSQVLPGMLGTMEHVDVGALVAPRPLFVETGRDDPLFPVAAAERSIGRLRRVYGHLGADGQLVHEVSEGEHQWYGRGAYGFLGHHLGGDRPGGPGGVGR